MNETIYALLHDYKLTKNAGILNDILYELGNTELWVPLSIKPGEQKPSNNRKNESSTQSKDVYLQTAMLSSGNRLYFPLFVSKEDSPKDYREGLTWLSITLNQAADYVLKTNSITGIVVNAFTDPFVISREFIEYRAQKVNSYSVMESEQVLLEPLKKSIESERLLFQIRDFANKEHDIQLIYALYFTRGNNKSYLISIETSNSDYENKFRKMNAYLHKGGSLQYPIDYCLCSESFMNDMKHYGIEPVWYPMMKQNG